MKIAEGLFGDKAGNRFAGFVADYLTAAERTEDKAQRKLLLSDEQIQQMSDAQKLLNEINTTYDEIKMQTAANLTVKLGLVDVLNNASVAFADLAEVFLGEDTEQRAEAIIKLDNSISTLVESLTGAFTGLKDMLSTTGAELQASDNPVLKALGNLLITFSGMMESAKGIFDWAIEWLNQVDGDGVSNMEKVLNALAVDWTVKLFSGKSIGDWVASIGGDIVKLYALILTWSKIKSFGGGSGAPISGLGDAAANAATGTTGATLISKLTTAAQGLWSIAKASALPLTAAAVTGYIGTELIEKPYVERLNTDKDFYYKAIAEDLKPWYDGD